MSFSILPCVSNVCWQSGQLSFSTSGSGSVSESFYLLNNLLLLDEVVMAEWAMIVRSFRRSLHLFVVFSYKVDLSPERINFIDPYGSQPDIDVDVPGEVARTTLG